MKLPLLLSSILVFALSQVRAQVQINEIMASNVRAYPDITDFEDYPDWFELKNTTGSPVSLNGYFISDSVSNPYKWAVPSGATIPANGYLLFMADGHDAAPGQTFPRGYWPWKNFVTEKYHTNFNLSSGGESLTLTHTTGVTSIPLVNASTSPPAANWKYLDNGSDQSTQWRARNFDDSTWASGPSELGYGSAPATTVGYGPDPNHKYITTYFRHHFTVSNLAAIQSLMLDLLVDDGCIIYLNGMEIVRQNMPASGVNYLTQSSTAVSGAATIFYPFTLPPDGLLTGDNVLAVEVHQSFDYSSDISLDIGLRGISYTGSSTVDTVSYTQQVGDVSYGRDSANPATWEQFAEPTPGAANTTTVVNNVRVSGNKVTISLPGGLYSSNRSVTLTSSGGGIRYTLDGSNPSSTSALYTAPLSVTATTVLRARCFEAGKAPGPIATSTYLFGETLTNVPYISVVADPNTLFGNTIGIYKNEHETVSGSYGLKDVYKGKDAPGNVEFFGAGGSGNFAANCGIRIGGENNWPHPQKALNIYFRGQYGNDSVVYDVFPGSHLHVHSALTLREGGDNCEREMLRDSLWPKLAQGYLHADTADYRPSVVFINGAYYGIHNVRQRWDETWYAQKYHLPADKIDHLIYGHITSPSITLGVDKGSNTDWLALLDFINTADLTLQANWDYVESKIDMDSFMDFVISESYGNNISWPHNREFWKGKNPGEKWHWFLPDMDRTWDTATLTGVLSDMLANETVLVRLKANTGFKQRLAQRYAAHAAGTFKASRVISVISAMDAEVSALAARHITRWAPNGMTTSGRASNIQNIKDYATQRAANFAAEVTTQLGVGTAVNLTLAHNATQGSVLVQGVRVDPSTFKMFPNISFALTAVPAPGYAFSVWTGATGGASTTATIAGAASITANFVTSGETVIGGTLASNTTLTAAGSPYALSSDLIVPAGITLTVQPGVTIGLSAEQNIRIQGVININGTAALPVTINGRFGARWGGMSLENPSGPSSMAHLIVRGATRSLDPSEYSSAITGLNATAVMDFLDIRDCEGPVYFYGGSCTVRDSVLAVAHVGDSVHVKRGIAVIQRCDFPGNTAPDTDAIDFDGVTNGLVEDCRLWPFTGFNSDGIDIGEACSNVLIQRCVIYGNADKGVSCGQGSSITVRKCLIVGCDLGFGIKDAGSAVAIDQCTIASCRIGVDIYEKNFGAGGGSAAITNTIISKMAEFPVNADSFSSFTASYNLSDTQAIPGSNNILADPQFVDPFVYNYQVKTTSPAINAGDPAHALDPDNSRVDIGAEYAYNPNDYPYTIGETVVINEILANSGVASDWIELCNRTNDPVNIGGWFLSDDGSNLLKYRIPVGTIIAAGGYLVFYENTNFGTASVDPNKITAFALSDVGETVYLSSAVNDQLTDYRSKEAFGPSTEGETLGAYYKPSTDSYNFVAMKTPTPGAANSGPRVGPIVISEIMYNPAGAGTGDAEYLELLNVTNAPVTLYDSVKGKAWRISDGIDFEFPAATPLTMAPGERVVITKNLTVFNATYGGLVPAGTKVFEWITGGLSNAGENLQLDRPGAVDGLNVVQYVRQDRVNYDDAAPWPTTPDGTGPSLTKILEREYGNDYINWMAAAATPGGASSQPPPDYDGDGIPDVWEMANGLNPYNASDAALDSDGDGQSNRAEYLAGTNPHNAASHLSASLAPTLTPGEFAVRFTAIAGKAYTVRYKNALTDGVWTNLADVPAPFTDTLYDVIDPVAGAQANRFYQVVTPQQP